MVERVLMTLSRSISTRLPAPTPITTHAREGIENSLRDTEVSRAQQLEHHVNAFQRTNLVQGDGFVGA